MGSTPPQFHHLTEETEIAHVTYSLSKDHKMWYTAEFHTTGSHLFSIQRPQDVIHHRVSQTRGNVQRQGELIKNKMKKKMRVEPDAEVNKGLWKDKRGTQKVQH